MNRANSANWIGYLIVWASWIYVYTIILIVDRCPFSVHTKENAEMIECSKILIANGDFCVRSTRIYCKYALRLWWNSDGRTCIVLSSSYIKNYYCNHTIRILYIYIIRCVCDSDLNCNISIEYRCLHHIVSKQCSLYCSYTSQFWMNETCYRSISESPYIFVCCKCSS